MAEGDTVIHELEHGYQVPSERITEAAYVPPATMTPIERANLITRLEHAKVLDEHGINDHNDNPILTEDFIEQSRRADRAIRLLRSGKDLSSEEISEMRGGPRPAATPSKLNSNERGLRAVQWAWAAAVARHAPA